MDLEEVEWELWTGFIWLRMGTSNGLLWMWQWTFMCHRRTRISWLAEWLSFSGRTAFHGLVMYWNCDLVISVLFLLYCLYQHMHEEPITNNKQVICVWKGDILCVNSSGGTETCTRLVIEKLGFNSQQGQDFVVFSILSRQALEHTQPSLQWVPGTFSLENEADHSPSFSTEIKNMWIYSNSLYIFVADTTLL
jgi:hypothetical protein